MHGNAGETHINQGPSRNGGGNHVAGYGWHTHAHDDAHQHRDNQRQDGNFVKQTQQLGKGEAKAGQADHTHDDAGAGACCTEAYGAHHALGNAVEHGFEGHAGFLAHSGQNGGQDDADDGAAEHGIAHDDTYDEGKQRNNGMRIGFDAPFHIFNVNFLHPSNATLGGVKVYGQIDGEVIQHCRNDGGNHDGRIADAQQLSHYERSGPHHGRHNQAAGRGGGFYARSKVGLKAAFFSSWEW